MTGIQIWNQTTVVPRCHKWFRKNNWTHTKRLFLLGHTFCTLSHMHSRPTKGFKSTPVLADMCKGTGADTFAALQVRLTESVIISVEHSAFCVEPSHKNLDLLM